MKIISIKNDSQAALQGIRPHDEIVSINGGMARDLIDLNFYGSEDQVVMKIRRGTHEFEVVLDGTTDLGMEFEEMETMSCGNRCIFCFVDQNPPCMRKNIYFKDEDYRLSFLHGSYVTLTAMKESDLRRIEEQRLSPLYVSVHASDIQVRAKMLGISKDDKLMEKIDRLITSGIKFHCQIVVCPDINYGPVLMKSIRDLRKRYPGVLSVAIVPVGLTKHRDGLYPLKEVDAEHASKIIRIVDKFHYEFVAETGSGFVYCADELYIRAGYKVPVTEYYDDFPQYENGVGMVRNFLNAASHLEDCLNGIIYKQERYVLVTGASMAKYLEDFAQRLSAVTGAGARAVNVRNVFYGDSVTVTGLLTGMDIIAALKGIRPDETVILPPNCLNESGVFLDDMLPDDIKKTLGVRVVQGTYDPVDTFKGIQKDFCKEV